MTEINKLIERPNSIGYFVFVLQLISIPYVVWSLNPPELSFEHGSPWMIYTGIIYSYIAIIFAMFSIFIKKINWVHICVIPVIAFLCFEFSLLKYLVYITELIINGRLNFEDAQFRHADKQNIYVAFIMTSFCCLSYIVYRKRGGVQYRSAMGLIGVLFFAFFLYHVNILNYQGSVFLKDLKRFMNTEMSEHVYSDDYLDGCPKVKYLKCHQWMDGSQFPQEARVQGSDWLMRLNKDYDAGWVDLKQRKDQFEPGGKFIWKEAFINDNLDNTFAPQYYLHIVFMKYEGLNRLMIYSGALNKILSMGAIAGVNLLFMMLIWLSGSVLITTTHRNRPVEFSRRKVGLWFLISMCLFTVLAVELNVFACAAVVAYFASDGFKVLRNPSTIRSILWVLLPVTFFYLTVYSSGMSLGAIMAAAIVVFLFCLGSIFKACEIRDSYLALPAVLVCFGLIFVESMPLLSASFWGCLFVVGCYLMRQGRLSSQVFIGLYYMLLALFSVIFISVYFKLISSSGITDLDAFYAGSYLTYYSMAVLAFTALRPSLIYLIRKHESMFRKASGA